MDYLERAREVLNLEAEGLRKVCRELGTGFPDAVRLMLACLGNGRKIVVTGVGKNLHVAEKISATLASTGATSVVLHPSQAAHGDLGVLCEGDVLLALSYSGGSDELLNLIPVVKRLGVRIVAVTESADNALGRLSDLVIPVKIDREACPFNLAPTTSTTATMAVGDALAMVMLEARGVDREDFAKLHPGGAIGRALLLRVSDIMRSGDRLVSVHADAPVKQALVAMTRARSGSAAVVDDQNRVLGIFTDGDLRRHIAEQSDLLNLPVRNVMTAAPLTVREDQLAVDVLRIYEEHNVDDLLVVDGRNRLAGAIDIQDLPKFKIL